MRIAILMMIMSLCASGEGCALNKAVEMGIIKYLGNDAASTINYQNYEVIVDRITTKMEGGVTIIHKESSLNVGSNEDWMFISKMAKFVESSQYALQIRVIENVTDSTTTVKVGFRDRMSCGGGIAVVLEKCDGGFRLGKQTSYIQD